MIIDKLLQIPISFFNNFGLLLLFLATFLESAPLIGLFIPGSLFLFVAGIMIKLGLMSVWGVLLFAVFGAAFGDLMSYLFGKYLGKEFLHKYGSYFLIKKEYVEKTGEVACNHVGKSLVFGRLNPLTRSSAPFIIGAHKLKLSKFMIYNVLGAVLWGSAFIILGYFFGHSYSFSAKLERTILLSTLTIAFLLYSGYFISLFLRKRNTACELKKLEKPTK